MRWLIKKYMAERHIESMTELAKATGMTRKTLYDRINAPESIRIYELKALDEALHFSDDDIAKLARGQV